MKPIYELAPSNRFLRELERMRRRKKQMDKLQSVLDYLMAGVALPAKYKDHALKGNWLGYRDCHIEPDWVLIYQRRGNDLYLTDMGSHANLFNQ